ncbi:MAG: asparagine synthase C-terminal domain-containing protein, partial [Syntrophorhabdaceae bacterium]
MAGIAGALRRKLAEVFEKFHPECILFSGGLDSSIAAALSGCKTGIIVTLGDEAPDLEHARKVAASLGMKLIHRKVSAEDALKALPDVIRILQSFDPAIPNDMTVFFGLEEARARGFRSVMTGDGSDELFGGYPYMASLGNLNGYIRHLADIMSFNSELLGRHFNLDIIQPFLDPQIVEMALNIDPALKIRHYDEECVGKWILRYAVQDILPEDEIWQDKRPLETGSGMTELN